MFCGLQLVLDTDGDGRISEAEILAAAKDILAKLRTGGETGAPCSMYCDVCLFD